MMEQQPDKTPAEVAAAVADDAATPPFSVGSTLREARERMGLSIPDVVNRLKFAPRQVKALEEDNFKQLPEVAFVRGFVRSYARLLQLDEAPLLAALPDAQAQQEESTTRHSVEVPFPNVYSIRKSNIIWLAAALLVTVALGVFTWLRSAEAPVVIVQAPETQLAAVPPVVAEAEQAAPVDTAESRHAVVKPKPVATETKVSAVETKAPVAESKVPAASKAAPAVPGIIRIAFDEESWVEVKDKDDKVLLSLLGDQGSEQNVNGTPPFAITIGHASGVQLYYKGKQVDLAPYTRAEVAHLTLE